jgi:hypothetical protein
MKNPEYVRELPDDAFYVSQDQQVEDIKERLKIDINRYNWVNHIEDRDMAYTYNEKIDDRYDSFFVLIKDGKLTRVWGLSGIIPYLNQHITLLLEDEKLVTFPS